VGSLCILMAGGSPGGGPGGSIPGMPGGLITPGGSLITGAPPGPRYTIGTGGRPGGNATPSILADSSEAMLPCSANTCNSFNIHILLPLVGRECMLTDGYTMSYFVWNRQHKNNTTINLYIHSLPHGTWLFNSASRLIKQTKEKILPGYSAELHPL